MELDSKILKLKTQNSKQIHYNNAYEDLINQKDLLQLKYDYYKTKNVFAAILLGGLCLYVTGQMA